MNDFMRYALALLLLAPPLSAQTFSVIHEKRLWRDGRGTITIDEKGIVYTAGEEQNSRAWSYEDIQYFDRVSTKEFTILSYEDRKLWLGRDRAYHFVITEGELTDEIFRTVSRRIEDPLTNRVVTDPAPEQVRLRLPVKHLHTLGGCEGVLHFTVDRILYVTPHAKDAREWLMARDLQSVWSADRYQLEIHAYDNNRRQFSQTRTYRFSLKDPLDPEFYRRLKLQLYDLEQTHLQE